MFESENIVRGISSRLRSQGRLLRFAVVLAVLYGMVAGAQPYKFNVVAGGYLGDGQSAKTVGLTMPAGIAFDAAGNLYIAQVMENRIRKVSPSGVTSTYVGTSAYGFSGDHGLATQATLRNPLGLAIDAAGNLYFSDSLNHRVRKVTPAGTITTIAGNGSQFSGGDGGQAINAGIPRPYGLALDAAGNLYIAESLGRRVRKVAPNGVISTVAGNGADSSGGDGGPATEAGLNEPTGVAVDASGNLYIADSRNGRVRRVDALGTITSVAGSLSLPYGIAIGPDGLVYVSSQCFIHRIGAGGERIHIVGQGSCEYAGDNGPTGLADITTPEGIAFDAEGSLYFADSEVGRIRKIKDGMISTAVGRGSFHGDGGPAIAATLSSAQGVAVGGDGSIYIADSYPNSRVRKVGPTGIVNTFAGNGIFGEDGDGTPAVQASLFYPIGVMLDDAGNVYIADRVGNKVRKVGGTGTIDSFAGAGLTGGSEGDGLPATSAKLWRPTRTAIDRNGNVYIAETNNHRIRKVSPGGIITTIAGNPTAGFSGDGGPASNAQFNRPIALAVDLAGNIYVADAGNMRVRKIAPNGIISTIAGIGASTWPSGDGGLATRAALTGPTGLALDGFGNLYIADTTLRKLTPTGTISTVKGMTHFAYDVATDSSGAIYVGTLGARVLKGVLTRAVESDFNGDGYADILWRNAATGGNGYWGSASSGVPRNLAGIPDLKWKVAGNGDFNGDGRSDVLWRNDTTGQNTLWFSAESTTYQHLTTITDLAWKFAGVGDFDGDKRADILWRHIGNGANAIWRTGNSADRPAITAVTNQAWKVAGIGDFDGDGRADILWHNVNTGASSIWKAGNYASAQNLTTVTDLRWKIIGVGDFNGDGKSDILWHHSTTGANAFWKSGLQSQNLTTVTEPAWQIVAVGDYDADGTSDLLWRHATSGRNTVWKRGDIADQLTVATLPYAEWKVMK